MGNFNWIFFITKKVWLNLLLVKIWEWLKRQSSTRQFSPNYFDFKVLPCLLYCWNGSTTNFRATNGHLKNWWTLWIIMTLECAFNRFLNLTIFRHTLRFITLVTVNKNKPIILCLWLSIIFIFKYHCFIILWLRK